MAAAQAWASAGQATDLPVWRPTALHDHTEWAGKGVQARDEAGLIWRLGSRAWVLADDAQALAATAQVSSDARVWLAEIGRAHG